MITFHRKVLNIVLQLFLHYIRHFSLYNKSELTCFFTSSNSIQYAVCVCVCVCAYMCVTPNMGSSALKG